MSLMRSACEDEAAASTSKAIRQRRMNTCMSAALEGCKHGIEEPRQPTHAVGVVDDALARVADMSIRNLVGSHRVIGRDVRRPYHPRDMNELIALIELQTLVALHHQIAVGLHINHRHGEAAHQT